MISINTKLEKQLNRLRNKSTGKYGEKTSYSSIIEESIREAGMWKNKK